MKERVKPEWSRLNVHVTTTRTRTPITLSITLEDGRVLDFPMSKSNAKFIKRALGGALKVLKAK